MRILVTGHKGFIGSRIYEDLVSSGLDVDGIDAGDQIPDKAYDYVVHMGARTLIRLSKEKPFEYFEDNMVLALKILELSRKNGSTLIFPTSGSVSEATNPYSLSKKQIVEWIELYHKLYGVKRHILKFYNIYGPTSRKGAVYLFCNAALKGEPITVYGDGTHIRDFIHVDDVVRGVQMIISGKVDEGYHEVGTGTGTSVNDLIKMVERISGTSLTVKSEEYILPEGERLVAKDPLISDPISLENGVKEVIEALKGSSGSL